MKGMGKRLAVQCTTTFFLALVGLAVVPAFAATSAAKAAKGEKMDIQKSSFGKTADGAQVDLYTLTNPNGMTVSLMTYGATLIRVDVPDREGKARNVNLYLDTLDDYLAGHPFFGCVAGRYGNRIAGAKFTLDGAEHQLVANEGANQLHGGKRGFDKHVWTASPVRGANSVGVELSLTSPDGDQGFPGKLTAKVTYSLTGQNELKMEYSAQTDKPTHVNLTNHSYWNLAGAGSGTILDHLLMLNADRYLPVDDKLIPLGELRTVKGTPMDFTKPEPIGSRIAQVPGGYDHCYVLNKKTGDELSLAARVVDPKSGRVMEVWTTEPGVQVYTANFLTDKVKAGGVAYGKHHALCLETQHYPDSPNRPEFPSTVLRPGQTYKHTTIHKFSVQK